MVCRYYSLLVEAGRTLTYVETVDPTKADSLHRSIKSLYNEDLMRCFEQVVCRAIKLLNIDRVEIAFDTHGSLYWGELAGLNVRQIKHERGADAAWEWLVVSIVKPVPIPLMAVPYRQGDDLATLAIGLLGYVASLPLTIKLCLFDRGFYIGQLIDFLVAKKIPYLILVPENDAMKCYAEQTEGIAAFKHEMRYSTKKSTWKPTTRIVVIKNVLGRENKKHNMYYATTLPATYKLLRIYPHRWQIETNFRVIKEAKIKSKSNNLTVRFFYFLVQLMLHIGWNLTKRIIKPLPFKRYLKELEQQLILDQGIT